MGYFLCRETMQHLLCLRQQLLKVVTNEDKRMNLNIKVFLGRKNEVVGELNDAFEILAAAFGIELKHILMHKMGLVLVLMPQTMQTRLRCLSEAARQMMVFGAIMELHVPTHRDEKHHKGHHQGADLQNSFFHAAKIGIILLHKSH